MKKTAKSFICLDPSWFHPLSKTFVCFHGYWTLLKGFTNRTNVIFHGTEALPRPSIGWGDTVTPSPHPLVSRAKQACCDHIVCVDVLCVCVYVCVVSLPGGMPSSFSPSLMRNVAGKADRVCVRGIVQIFGSGSFLFIYLFLQDYELLTSSQLWITLCTTLLWKNTVWFGFD